MSAPVSKPPVYMLQTVPVEVLDSEFDLEAVLQRCTDRSENSFFLIDLGCVRQQVAMWRTELPRAVPHYAVKCNPNPVILRLLAELRCSFDCASLAEIQTVLSLGVSPSRIIYANPCKFPAHIRAAHKLGVDLMTFDNEDELEKIHSCNPYAQVVMRIATDDSKAMCRFSSKFGVQQPDVEPLVARCAELGVKLVGVSFHVGSGSSDDTVYPTTLRAARAVFDTAAQYGFELDLVDIGGGFPGVPDWNPSFPALAAGIRPALDELFPPHVRVIGEPGRYMVARSHTLAVNCYARRMTAPDSDNNVLYYLDDGVYGSFSCIPFDNQKPVPHVFSENRDRPLRRCTLFGPTCDSLDCIGKDLMLPEVRPGEWLYFTRMGAYTTASSTKFNGFFTSRFFYVDSDRHCCDDLPSLPEWARLDDDSTSGSETAEPPPAPASAGAAD